MRNLANIDLNLLRMLRVLLETRSVTRSGEKLGLSQPAASRVVAKLRYLFNDPLLERTSRGYVLTPVANALLPKVLAAMASAEQVFLPTVFDPTTMEREFRIGTTDYGSLTVIVAFASYLLRNAPRALLTVSGWSEETFQELENGDLDIGTVCRWKSSAALPFSRTVHRDLCDSDP